MSSPSPMIDLIQEWAQAHGATPRGDMPPGSSGDRPEGELEFVSWGATDDLPQGHCEVVASLGSVELEYAAIHRGTAIMDMPHRGVVVVKGGDRHEFLDRLVTNKVTGNSGEVVEAFLLDRSGRILAEVVIATLRETTWLTVDVAQAEVVSRLLESFVFTEDVQITGPSEGMHTIEAHGPGAGAMVSTALGQEPVLLADRSVMSVDAGGEPIVIWRLDALGVPGFHLVGPRERIRGLVETILEDDQTRITGWFAYNIARVESVSPMMNVDYGTRSIPNETGLLATHVSPSKGCYPGQEIVTRIASRGQPRQRVVGLDVAGDRLPVAGAQIFADESGSIGPPVGVVTSSAISPMRGAVPVALATIKTASADPGTVVRLTAEGEETTASVVWIQENQVDEAEAQQP